MYLFDQWSRRHVGMSSALFFFACTLFSGSAQATTYNAVNDFSTASNPNGTWSYLSGGALMGSSGSAWGGYPGLDYWWNSGTYPNQDGVVKNVTGSTFSYASIVLPADYLNLSTQTGDADVRFSAPSTGTYSITGDFLGIDIDEAAHPVEILDDGTVIFSGTMGAYGQSDTFGLSESLHAGDVLDFDNLTGSSYFNLSTGLAVTITPAGAATPEPATRLISGVGLVGFSLLRFRCRRAVSPK